MKHRKPTQKEIVLKMLEEAGDKGVHSFEFMQIQLPRVAARICELRAEGYEITSEHELLHGSATGVRYRLVGIDAETSRTSPGVDLPGRDRALSVDSSQDQGGDASGTGSIPGATVVAEGASGDSGAPSELTIEPCQIWQTNRAGGKRRRILEVARRSPGQDQWGRRLSPVLMARTDGDRGWISVRWLREACVLVTSS